MNSWLKIGIGCAGALLLLLCAVYLYKQDRQAGQQNTISSVGEVIADRTFCSKHEAYDAFANEKERFYNRSAGFFERPAPKSASSETSMPNETSGAASNKTSKGGLKPQSDGGSSRNTRFDEAYDEIVGNVRQIYESDADRDVPAGSKSSSAPEVQFRDAAQRRREAMRRDWGVDRAAEQTSVSGVEMFHAVIHGTQLVKSGQTALFRTKEPIRYGDLIVPANTLLSGFAMISENRLTVKINSVRLGHEVSALPLEIYGSDGIAGIPLNYDDVGKIAGAQTASTTIQEAGSAVARYGGAVGRVAGALMSGVGGQVRSAKNMEVKLIDNQMVILKFVEQ